MNFTTVLNEYPALKKLYFCEYNEELLETQMHLTIANKEELVERIKRNKAMIGNKRKGALVLQRRQFIGQDLWLLLEYFKRASSQNYKALFDEICETELKLDAKNVNAHIQFSAFSKCYDKILFSGLEFVVLKKHMLLFDSWFQSEESTEFDSLSKMSRHFWIPMYSADDLAISFASCQI